MKQLSQISNLFPCQALSASQHHASLNPETTFQTVLRFRSSSITAAAPVVNDVCSLTNSAQLCLLAY